MRDTGVARTLPVPRQTPDRRLVTDPFTRTPGWWGERSPSPEPLSVTQLIADGTLDEELAALLWLLVEGHVPLIVAAEAPGAGKTTLLTALLAFLPATTRTLLVRGWEEDFAWLPDADALGWPGDPATSEMAHPERTYLLAPELSAHLPAYTWGVQARVLLRSLQRGYGLGTTAHADSLEELLAALGAPPVSLTEDELRLLGVVLVLRTVDEQGRPLGRPAPYARAPASDGDARRRVVAAHYVRPPERDAGGHVQRRRPAVLSTWDAKSDRLEHFAWGVTPELALRVGRSQADFERTQDERAQYLRGLVTGGVVGHEDVVRAIDGHRRSDANAHLH